MPISTGTPSGGGGGAPSGPAGGVLAGTYPNPALSDADLVALAALDSSTSGAIASDGAGWIKKTYAQFKTALGLVKGDVGLGNVDNTADAAKAVASAAVLTTARSIDGQSFDGSANIAVVAPGTHAATSKATPVDADELPLVDSAAANVLKKLTWANLKATLKTYFDGLYPSGSGTSTGTNTGDQATVSGNAGTATTLQTARTINGVSFDGSANITNIAEATHAATSKTTPLDADEIPLVDTAASNVLKKLTGTNLKAYLKTYFDTLYSAIGAVTSVSGRTGAVTYTANQVTKAAPGSNSASASELMAGIAGSITPVGTSIYIAIAGTYGMSLTTASVKLQGRYGTGTAPVLDAASTGTAFGLQMQTLETAATSRGIPFTLIGLVAGLTAGTAYWLDVGVTGDGTNIPTLKYCTVVAFDV